uniref:Uncharacterized protein n=1 Tax=Mycena chlorophos TaxID=658473 RepID=A0ABQ0L061_MYCCL|nr:predicted protein [Mycena chlorophos]
MTISGKFVPVAAEKMDKRDVHLSLSPSTTTALCLHCYPFPQTPFTTTHNALLLDYHLFRRCRCPRRAAADDPDALRARLVLFAVGLTAIRPNARCVHKLHGSFFDTRASSCYIAAILLSRLDTLRLSHPRLIATALTRGCTVPVAPPAQSRLCVRIGVLLCIVARKPSPTI